MLDLEREQLRKTYQLCRTGFSLAVCAGAFMHRGGMLTWSDCLATRASADWIVNSPWNHWVTTVERLG